MQDTLFEQAKKVSENAHCPYSKFPVGAAILTDNNKVFVGCNVENAAYPSGWCAETSAIANMIAGGENKIAEICVVATKMEAATPCGKCRQQIAEFGTQETIIHLCSNDGIVRSLTLAELLPESFGM